MEKKLIIGERLKSLLSYVALIIVIFILTRLVGFSPVEGSSMCPTIKPGQVVVVDKTAASSVEKGDIVIAKPEQTDKVICKRLIADGGDIVKITKDGVYVDGELLPDTRGAYADNSEYCDTDIRLADGQVFLLGDNYAVSFDSRYYGAVDKDSIIGRVVRIL